MVNGDEDSISSNNHDELDVNIERRNVSKKILIKGRKVKRLTKNFNELDESDEEFFNSSDGKKPIVSKSHNQSDNSSEKSDDSKTFGLKFHNKLLNTGKILSHWNDNPQKIIVDMKLLERTNKIIQKIATVGLDNPSSLNNDEQNFESKPLERWSSSIESGHETDSTSKTNPIVEEKLARIQQVETQIAKSELPKVETIFYDKENCSIPNAEKDMEKSKEIFDKTLATNDTAQALINFSNITNSWLSGLSSATKIVGEATKTAASTTMNHAAKQLVNAQNIILTNAASLPVAKNLTNVDRLIFGQDNQPTSHTSSIEPDSTIADDWANDWDDEPIVLAKKSQTLSNETTIPLSETKEIPEIGSLCNNESVPFLCICPPYIPNSNDSSVKEEPLDGWDDNYDIEQTKIPESNENEDVKSINDGWDHWEDDETSENVESFSKDLKSKTNDHETQSSLIKDDVDEIGAFTEDQSPAEIKFFDQISCPSEIPPFESADDQWENNDCDIDSNDEIILNSLPSAVNNPMLQQIVQDLELKSDNQFNNDNGIAEKVPLIIENFEDSILTANKANDSDNIVSSDSSTDWEYQKNPIEDRNESFIAKEQDEIVDGWDDWEDKEIEAQITDEQPNSSEIEHQCQSIEQKPNPIDWSIDLNSNDMLTKESELNVQEIVTNHDKNQIVQIDESKSDEKISTDFDLQLESENLECNTISAATLSDLDAFKEKITTVIDNISEPRVLPSSTPSFEEMAVETTAEKIPLDQINDDELQIKNEEKIEIYPDVGPIYNEDDLDLNNSNSRQEGDQEKNDWCEKNIDNQIELEIIMIK